MAPKHFGRRVREDTVNMFKAIEDKALELYAGLIGKLHDLRENESGQTSAEYIAVTAVAVLIAITVIYAAFSDSLDTAITNIGDELNSWVDSSFGSV